MGLLQLILVYILVSSAKCNAKFLKFEEKSLIDVGAPSFLMHFWLVSTCKYLIKNDTFKSIVLNSKLKLKTCA